MHKVSFRLILCLLAVAHFVFAVPLDPPLPDTYLQFDGAGNYVEVPNSTDLSVSTTGGLTIAAWMRPDALLFPNTEGSGYVHWLGKGQARNQEWVFRMYSQDNTEGRDNRISFYVFNLGGGRGCGSYFQDPIQAGQWIHVVGVADSENTYIYKNGVFRNVNRYAGTITPDHGNAPMSMGTRDFASFFNGAMAQVRVWNRPLDAGEISDLYASGIVPQDGLVAEYLMNEGADTTVFDTVGGNDGTVFGATWSSDPSPADNTSGQSGGGC